jgi:hypothetical protein
MTFFYFKKSLSHTLYFRMGVFPNYITKGLNAPILNRQCELCYAKYDFYIDSTQLNSNPHLIRRKYMIHFINIDEVVNFRIRKYSENLSISIFPL